MPLRLTCPGCKRTVSVPDEAAGKTVRCPACKTPFVVPAVEPEPVRPAVRDDDEDEPRPRKRPARSDEDDRPRRRPKRRSRRGPPWGLIAGVGGGVLALATV